MGKLIGTSAKMHRRRSFYDRLEDYKGFENSVYIFMLTVC